MENFDAYIILFAAVFTAFAVKGTTGFGNTLVMDSLLSFTLSNRIISPLDLLLGAPANAYIAWKERKSISLRVVVPLSLLFFAGIIPGAFFLKNADDKILKSFLGLVLVAMAVEMLLRKRISPKNEPKKESRAVLAAVGIFAGVLAGIYGIGALLASYAARVSNGRSGFRADICCVFLAGNIFRLALYTATGIFTVRIFKLALALSPAAAFGMFAGIKLNSRINDASATIFIAAMLLASGAALFLRSILFS